MDWSWWSVVIAVGAGLLLLWIALIVALWLVRPDELRVRDALRLLPDLVRLLRRLAADRSLHTTPADTLGSLNLFHTEPGACGEGDEAIAHILAHHASIALPPALRDKALTLPADASGLIGQAQGLLMERYHLDAEQAFAILRRYSQKHNVELREVARFVRHSPAMTAPPRSRRARSRRSTAAGSSGRSG